MLKKLFSKNWKIITALFIAASFLFVASHESYAWKIKIRPSFGGFGFFGGQIITPCIPIPFSSWCFQKIKGVGLLLCPGSGTCSSGMYGFCYPGAMTMGLGVGARIIGIRAVYPTLGFCVPPIPAPPPPPPPLMTPPPSPQSQAPAGVDPESIKFASGEKVKTDTSVQVRSAAGISSPVVGTQPKGAPGVMVGYTATKKDGYWWYNIDFETGPDGFVQSVDLVKFKTDIDPPSVPKNFVATPISPTQINLSWGASTDTIGVAGYRIARNNTHIATTSNTYYSDTNLLPETLYSYGITAFDEAINISDPTGVAAQTWPPYSTKFSISSRAEVSANSINVRATPSVLGILLGEQLFGNGGIVIGGPLYNDSFWWWKIDYDEGSDGWSAENYLGKPEELVVLLPTALTGSSTSPTSINLSWAAPTEGEYVGFKIYRNGLEIGTSVNTSYKDTGLLPLRTYEYAIAAYDANGNTTKQTPILKVTTLPPPPSTKFSLNMKVEAISAFSIQSSSQASTTPIGRQNTGSIGTVVDGPVYSDDKWFWNVNYDTGVDGWSNEIFLKKFVDIIPPTVPSGVFGFPVSSSGINLSWNASSDYMGVTGYNVFRNGTKITTTTGTSYSGTGLSAATTYSYSVSAFDAAGNASAQSSAFPVQTQPLSPPGNLTGIAVSPTQINLSWAPSSSSGITGYTIFRNGTKITTVTGTSYSDNGLTGGSAYSYTVSAFDAGGSQSAQSGGVTVQTPVPPPDTAPPSTPAGLTAQVISSTQINLSWSASTDNIGVAGYRIYRDGLEIGTSPTASFQNTGLSGSTTYSYAVSAFDSSGNASAQSVSVAAITPQPPPSTKFSIGSRAQATANLNVRQTPSLSGAFLGLQPTGRQGTVIGGPTFADGYSWWQMDYDLDPDGWSVEDYLSKL